MSDAALVRLGWGTWAMSIALVAAGVAMLLAVHYGFPGVAAYDYWRESTVLPTVYATVGLMITKNRPRHPVGWLLVGFALIGALQLAFGQYAVLAAASGLPARSYALWASNQAQGASVGLLVLILLLFPTGRLPSPRWRLVAWSLVAGLSLVLAVQALMPGDVTDFPGTPNPFGVAALAPVLAPMDVVGGVLLVGGIIGAFASLAVRLRRSQGRERQQIKWFVYVGLLGIAAIILLPFLTGQATTHDDGLVNAVFNPWLLAPSALAITVATSIVRHRLYDIDRVINRTLVYVVLTALLAAVYAAGVLIVGRLLDPVDGQSELAVAASTLAVALLFQPARRRVQTAVDRRFNRTGYDAAQAVSAFSSRLRAEIELDTVRDDLLTVIDQTIEPAQVSLWLRRTAYSLCHRWRTVSPRQLYA